MLRIFDLVFVIFSWFCSSSILFLYATHLSVLPLITSFLILFILFPYLIIIISINALENKSEINQNMHTLNNKYAYFLDNV